MGPVLPSLSSSPSLLLFSLSPSLGADERQALSRQWHSKTSALGSSVSGYSTLLGAISLSKAWPAYSPTENPQISCYTRHTEGRHTAAFRVQTYVCEYKTDTKRRVNTSSDGTIEREKCIKKFAIGWKSILTVGMRDRLREWLHVCLKFMSSGSHAHLAASC